MKNMSVFVIPRISPGGEIIVGEQDNKTSSECFILRTRLKMPEGIFDIASLLTRKSWIPGLKILLNFAPRMTEEKKS